MSNVKKLVKRLKEGHEMYDLQFTQAAPALGGKAQCVLSLKLLKESDKGILINRSVTVTGLGEDIETAQVKALETAVELLGF